LKTHLTVFNPVTSYKEFINRNFGGVKLIAHCSPAFDREPVNMVYKRGENAIFLIGPEGDFTDNEIREATDRGFRLVHLGKSRLRTETAGVAACLSIYFINQ
ncbi:MAG: RsmE family RNA methyltransferase, partial [Bacteroidales bacterium]